MAGFEVIVRPAVFPDIRPAPAQPVSPADDPTQGFATIHGNGAKSIQVSYSYSASASSNTHSEIERRSDDVRVYQKTKDGKVNKDNYVDVRSANRIKTQGAPAQGGTDKPSFGWGQGPMPGDRSNYTTDREVSYYRRPKETDNTEIIKTDVIEKKGQGSPE